jgi:diguanylate cyclase (GGDEF)-like protein
VSISNRKNLTSPFADQRKRGFRWLLFSDFVEEEFRQYYAKSNIQRGRLIPVLAIAVTLISFGVRLAEGNVTMSLVLFDFGVLLPILGTTLYFSVDPRRHRLYQTMLAISTLLIGMFITSVVTRASMGGLPYYFAVEIAWLFVIWLILGLPFRHAAAVALLLSATYLYGSYHWNFDFKETPFTLLMLIIVNGIGAFCCYQLEYAVRRSFLESKVLGQLAERDGLTGLYNRRSYDEYIERLWRQSRREQAQLTLMLIDIDYFKPYNDFYGHQAGDDALRAVADVISSSAQRPLDVVARYGGEEFGVLLYGPEHEYGRELPEQLRESVLALKIPHEQSAVHQYLTVSIGVALVLPGTDRSLAGAIQMADEALYQAKEEGRNRVIVKESSNSHITTGKFRAAKRARS